MPARFACLVLVGATVAACSGPATLASGKITGHVMIRSCGGAYRPDQASCSLSPFPGALVSFQAKGKTVTASADSSGGYRIDLKPGTYAAKLISGVGTYSSLAEPFPWVAGPPQVTVTAGKTVSADFTYNINLL